MVPTGGGGPSLRVQGRRRHRDAGPVHGLRLHPGGAPPEPLATGPHYYVGLCCGDGHGAARRVGPGPLHHSPGLPADAGSHGSGLHDLLPRRRLLAHPADGCLHGRPAPRQQPGGEHDGAGVGPAATAGPGHGTEAGGRPGYRHGQRRLASDIGRWDWMASGAPWPGVGGADGRPRRWRALPAEALRRRDGQGAVSVPRGAQAGCPGPAHAGGIPGVHHHDWSVLCERDLPDPVSTGGHGALGGGGRAGVGGLPPVQRRGAHHVGRLQRRSNEEPTAAGAAHHLFAGGPCAAGDGPPDPRIPEGPGMGAGVRTGADGGGLSGALLYAHRQGRGAPS